MEIKVHTQRMEEIKWTYILKELNYMAVTQFRHIPLLNVEGKLFFSVMASLVTTYKTANKYVDRVMQKGGVPGIL